ncbi:hypothetical protein GE09DRAFT_459736 [Coniochaeta sp. 2T2.1]|nr:hypothetical protein GE09DRAFT_459736 [Coniochaeta sp. 2T2.1]
MLSMGSASDCSIQSLLVVDEVHKLRNNNTNTNSNFARQFETSRKISLTGPPIAEWLMELFDIVDWAIRGYGFGTEDHFSTVVPTSSTRSAIERPTEIWISQS